MGGIQLNFGVGNAVNTPAMITDTTVNKPAATTVAPGTVFFDVTTGDISQAWGGAWQSRGGGGGGTPGIDIVLAQAQQLTAARNIDLNDQLLQFVDSNSPGTNFAQFNQQLSFIAMPDFGLYFDRAANAIVTRYQGQRSGFSFDYGTHLFKLGDVENTNAGTFWQVDDSKLTLSSYSVNDEIGLFIDLAQNKYALGDHGYLRGQTAFWLDDSQRLIETRFSFAPDGISLDLQNKLYKFGYVSAGTGFFMDVTNNIYEMKSGSTPFGFSFDTSNNKFSFGDIGGFGGLSKIDFDGTNSTALLSAETVALSDAGAGTLLSGSSGGNSGQHLVITINGTVYKISLLNP